MSIYYLADWTCGICVLAIVAEKSNRKAINRNWSNQKANPKGEINEYYKKTKYNENKLLTEQAAISQKVATQQPKLN